MNSLFTQEIGYWGEEKYKLVHEYVKLFNNVTSNKWSNRVYLDLFSGSGEAKIRDTKELVKTSAIRAIDIPIPFTKYIYSDLNKDCIDSLKARIDQNYPSADVSYFSGDSNQNVEYFLKEMPPYSRQNLCIGFCILDIFKLENLKFSTIEKLSKRFFDFLVLIPTGMEIRRNMDQILTRMNDNTIDEFLNCSLWREKWNKAKESGETSDIFIMKCFGKKMADLGYIETDLYNDSLGVKNIKNRTIYHLFFYSRNELGKKLFNAAKKATVVQTDLFS